MEKKDKYKEMMDMATSDEEVNVSTSATEPKNIFKMVGISIGVIAVAIAIGFGAKTLLTTGLKGGVNTGGEGTQVVQVTAADLPARVPSFALQTYDKALFDSKQNNLAAVKDFAETYAFANTMPEVPSILEEGITSDINEKTNAEGGMNLFYYTATVEDYEYAFGVYSQMFLNPLFAGWSEDGKTKGELNADLFAGILTPEYLARAKEDINVLPIPSTDKLYFGTVTDDEEFYLNQNMEASFGEEQVIYTYKLKVNLGTFNNDGTIETKSGILSMSLTENYNVENNDDNRVLVTDASFTFE